MEDFNCARCRSNDLEVKCDLKGRRLLRYKKCRHKRYDIRLQVTSRTLNRMK